MDAGLSEFEATVLLYRVQGYMYQEIANALGKSAKSIDNALQRLNAKLRRVLADRLRPFLAA
jgi:DNA-directed RNA polymerase specialized sigma24 family protein